MGTTLEQWLQLSPAEQDANVADLDPYKPEPLFAEVQRLFVKEHGGQRGVDSVFCGLGPGVGPYNGIFVRIKRGQPRVHLPKRFVGFPVYRQYQRKNGDWQLS